jgi:hypothetical protein
MKLFPRVSKTKLDFLFADTPNSKLKPRELSPEK